MVSVCMATYNGADFVREQVASILEQIGPNDELLVSDDRSTDRTVEIIKSFSDPRLRLIVNDGQHGIVGNFENALTNARYDYLFICDQDDVWLPEKYSLLLSKIKGLEAAHGKDVPLLVHSDARVVDEKLETISDSLWTFQNAHPRDGGRLCRLLLQNDVTGCTAIINRALLDRALPFPSQVVMHDWWLALVAACFGEIEWHPGPLVCYRQHGLNDTGAKKWGARVAVKLLIDLLWNQEVIAENRRMNQMTRKQAEIFLKTYDRDLDPLQQRTIDAFLSLPHVSYIKRKFLTFKYGLHYHGTLRNLGSLIFR